MKNEKSFNSWLSIWSPKCSRPIRLQDSLKCNISRKNRGIKLIYDFQINIRAFYMLLLLLFVDVARLTKVLTIIRQYFKKDVRDKYDFCMKIINIKVFYKLIILFLLFIARHVQSIQNSKFVISLEYLKREARDEVDFWHADKYQVFLEVDTINWTPILGWKGPMK